MVNREAQIMAYSNDYRMLMLGMLPPLLLLLLLRRAPRLGSQAAAATAPARPVQAAAD